MNTGIKIETERLILIPGSNVRDNVLSVQKLYATMLAENIAVINLLSKLGFKRDIPKDGPVLIMKGFVDEENDEFFGYCVSKYVMEKEHQNNVEIGDF